jgi:hypothetical protein
MILISAAAAPAAKTMHANSAQICASARGEGVVTRVIREA